MKRRHLFRFLPWTALPVAPALAVPVMLHAAGPPPLLVLKDEPASLMPGMITYADDPADRAKRFHPLFETMRRS